MVEILVSIAGKVSEYVVDPVVRQLGYVYNYRTNIDELSNKVEKLKGTRNRHQHSVDAATRTGHAIEEDVSKWLKTVDGFIQEAANFIDDHRDHDEKKKSSASRFKLKRLSPNLKSQYLLGREAAKKAVLADQLMEDGSKFGGSSSISYLPPLQPHPIPPSEGGLGSRNSTLNAIMEALRDATVNRVGVWGLGGVGKTTLVKLVAQQAAEKKLFDEVLFASVLSTPDYNKIQQDLADQLGLQFVEGGEEARAARLRQRIMEEEKTILIILDDLWEEVDLTKIGVPYPPAADCCKFLLTSRNRDVLSNQMGTQKDFEIKHLEDDEASLLFKSTIGSDSISDPEFESLAMDIAQECGGLPIAIVTVATALKNKSLNIWKDALLQLRMKIGTSTTISGMESKVYESLRLSYKYLEGDEVKSFFLLCGLISSSVYYIQTSDLLKYGVGLGLFKGIDTLEHARNRIDALVDKLRASNLLLDTDNSNADVRMHDLIRKVAMEVAPHMLILQKADGVLKAEDWPEKDELRMFTVRDFDDIEFPKVLVCPNLQFLGCYDLNLGSEVKIPKRFFKEMKGLKVLDLTNMRLPSLPSSLECLTNLRTLCLNECELGDDISLIGELKTLEVLSLMDSDIKELPREIEQLTRLRLLDLEDSSKLKVIPADVIGNLTRLENLCMRNSFTKWEMKRKSNACLAELQSLPNLTSLDIKIPDAELLPEDIDFDKLERYKILVGKIWSWRRKFETSKTLKLSEFDTNSDMVDGISKLLKRTEDLHLRNLHGGSVSLSELDEEGFPKLKQLDVGSCKKIRYVMNSLDLIHQQCSAFPVLEKLSLDDLDNLQEIFHGQFPSGSFGCLRKIKVDECGSLKSLFPASLVKDHLLQLMELHVESCEIEEIIAKEENTISEIKPMFVFPKLTSLNLSSLNQLKNFYPEPHTSQWPSLKELTVCECDQVNLFASTTAHDHEGSSNTTRTRHPLFLVQSVAFPCLEKLTLDSNDHVTELWQEQFPVDFPGLRDLSVRECGYILVVIPPFMLQRLRNLEYLRVKRCSSVEEIFQLEGLHMKDQVTWLGCLREIYLYHLCELKHIWKGNSEEALILELKSLENLQVDDCGSLKILVPRSISFQNLQRLGVWSCDSLRSLMSASVAKTLVKLKTLEIGKSNKIEEVVDSNGGGEALDEIVFPKLQDIELQVLPNLTSFSSGGYMFSFPSLEHMTVQKCPKMKVFSSGSVIAPKLERIKVAKDKWRWKDDII